MINMKLKKGDTVLVTAGKDKGKRGKVIKILPRSSKTVVEKANIYLRHIKPRGKEQPGQILKRERPLPIANVALVCPKCNQQTRVGYQTTREEKKIRICRKCKGEID
jgi:large subunit ribosomal protein L24